MTLRSSQTIPISAALGSTSSSTQGSRVDLGVTFFPQEGPNWCWAACAVMGAHFFRTSDRTQRVIAATSLGDCDRAAKATEISRCWTEQGLHSTLVPREMTFGDVKFEIDSGRPVGVGWLWSGGGGHVVMAVGYEEDDAGNKWIFVHDPLHLSGSQRMAFSTLVTATGLGRWEASWYQLKT